MKPIKGKKDAPNFRISFKGEYYVFKYVNYKVYLLVQAGPSMMWFFYACCP